MSGFLDPNSQGAPEDRPRPDRYPTEPSSEPSLPWSELFEQSLPGLRAFLLGRLGQDCDVDDCLQVISVRMMEKGGDVAPAARRAWLFRVAANESARVWRSRASAEKALQKYASDDTLDDSPDETLSRQETNARLSQALNDLPVQWQRIVQLRIHENLTFQQIADQLNIPLGTALTQMRRALERLKRDIDNEP
jgi:RNA polymerase sigma factor (sigma-70 family)